jgi:hypothetical protein
VLTYSSEIKSLITVLVKHILETLAAILASIPFS